MALTLTIWAHSIITLAKNHQQDIMLKGNDNKNRHEQEVDKKSEILELG